MGIYANTEKLAFRIAGVDTTLVPVRFEGEEALSTLYRFTVLFLSEEPLDSVSIPGRRADLEILSADGGDRSLRTGIVTRLSLERSGRRCRLYTAVLEPRFVRMRQGRYSRIFLGDDQNVPLGGLQIRDIFPKLCRDLNLEANAWDFSGLSGVDFRRHYVCQYNESNCDFCARWMEYLGIFFLFEHGKDGDRLVALHGESDRRTSPPALVWHPGQGLNRNREETVFRLATHHTLAPRSLRVRDYNPDTPSVTIAARKGVDKHGQGDVYLFDTFLRSPEEASFIAQMRAEQLVAAANVLEGEADSASLLPGHVFTLEQHPSRACNTSYMVISSHLKGDQSGSLARLLSMDGLYDAASPAREPFCHTFFTCLPASIPYRPAQTTPIPRIAGVIQARVDAEGGETYAELDSEGRYKVILPFENFEHPGGRASCFVRMAQPYAGSHNGMHFPLLKGSEVGIAFTGGNVDRPYIECALPNARNISVSTERNQSQGKIVSLAGNTVLYEDLSGRERIEMHNPDTESLVVYGHFQSNTGILKSTPHTYADFVGGQRHIVIDGAGSYDGKAAGLYRYVGGDFFMQIQSANRIEDTAGYQTQQTMLDRNATIAGNRTLDVASNTELVVHDNLTEEIGGNRTITAKNMSLTTVTDYWHSNAQGNMTWTTATRHTDAAATSMDLQAPNISMTSQQHMEEVTNTYTENTVLRTITTIQNQQDMKKLFKLGLLNLTVCPLNVASNSLSGKICAVANISLEGTAIASTLLKIDIMVDKVSVTGPSNSAELVKISTKGKKTDIAPIRQLCLGAVFGWAGITNGLLNPLWVAKEVFLDARMFWPFLANLGINVTHFIAADNVKSAYENMVDNMTNVTYPQTSATVNPVSLVPKPQPQSQNTGTTGTAPLSDTERLAQNQSTVETLSESMDDAHEDACTSADNAHASHAEPDWMAPVPPVDNSILQSWNAPVPEDRPFTLLPEIPDGNP